MKLLWTIWLAAMFAVCSFSQKPLEVVSDPPAGPSLVAPASLKTNKAGRVRFEVKTNCKSVVTLADEDVCELDRVYTDPASFVYKFSADNPGVFKVVFVAAQADTPVIAQTVITYDGQPVPPAPPGPGPGPNPVPPGPAPNPTPGNLTKLYIVVIEDTASSKAGRGAYYTNTDLLARIKGKGWTFRVEDKAVTNAAGVTPPDLAPFIKVAAGKEPYVFLVNQTGKVLFEGPLPSAPSGLLDLIVKVGG